MKDKNIIRNEVQDKAVKNLEDNNYNGTVVLPTGLGKTFVLFKAIQRMYNQGRLQQGDELIFCAEVLKREETLETNAALYNELFNFDIYQMFKVQFYVYNTARTITDEEFKFVLFDEIHDGLTPENHKFLKNNTIEHLIGLTATPKGYIKYGKYTKTYHYKKLCPIVYDLPLEDAKKVGLMREIIYHRYETSLHTGRILKAGPKSKPFMTSEVEGYLYWDNLIEKLKKDYQASKEEDQLRLIQGLPTLERMSFDDYSKELFRLGLFRKKILYSLPSKAILYNQEIAPRLETSGKTLVFANSLDLLKKCQLEYILSGKNHKYVNQEYIDMFNNNEINVIGSYKIIEQGENLDTFDNMVILSYDSKIDQFIQRIGRARNADKPLKLIIHATKGTVEPGIIDKLEKKINIIDNTIYDVKWN